MWNSHSYMDGGNEENHEYAHSVVSLRSGYVDLKKTWFHRGIVIKYDQFIFFPFLVDDTAIWWAIYRRFGVDSFALKTKTGSLTHHNTVSSLKNENKTAKSSVKTWRLPSATSLETMRQRTHTERASPYKADFFRKLL
jgi:hypothetical protein